MTLRIRTPERELPPLRIHKLQIPAQDGALTMLPKHIDFVTVTRPGILSGLDRDDRQFYFAVDRGVLIKRGGEVSLSVVHAARGDDLRGIREKLDDQLRQKDDREREIRASLARLEADLAQSFFRLEREEL
jgi:F-type H+-transporting ATPase subunit epsilon